MDCFKKHWDIIGYLQSIKWNFVFGFACKHWCSLKYLTCVKLFTTILIVPWLYTWIECSFKNNFKNHNGTFSPWIHGEISNLWGKYFNLCTTSPRVGQWTSLGVGLYCQTQVVETLLDSSPCKGWRNKIHKFISSLIILFNQES